MEPNFSFRVVPRPFTTVIMASAIPAAIRPYSIAVAPDSSDKNFEMLRFKPASYGLYRNGSMQQKYPPTI